ncbi:MAG: type IV toxin-antitoxin system AbiEi family antitoxin domain-containing protein [Caldisericia bacterium]|nr:type IV toxin-antitoxin system AbiEi family antitoxin domain-containing protein [Caldisericia bacterium]
MQESEGIITTNSEKILQMALDNNGTITSERISKSGILRSHLKNLVDKGLLERISRGVYILPSAMDDDMLSLQTRFKRGVFSHETALFIHDLTDRTPFTFTLTFPLTYNTSSAKKENLRCIRVKTAYHSIGVILAKSPCKNLIRVYNQERTLCDILKTRSNTDIQIITDAFKRYVRLPQKNIPLLSHYSRMFHVEKRVRNYLDVLL